MSANSATLQEKQSMLQYLFIGLAFIGLVAFVAQGLQAMRTQISVLDEGAYLYKGWLFASGQYQPFQDYGPLTNHMPLSYLIPGYAQILFGPGLRTARLFALLSATVGLVGLWVATNKVGQEHGYFWGMIAIWSVALNPAYIKVYSQAVSQGISFTLIIWSLALALPPNKHDRNIYWSALLAGIATITRINLAPYLFFLLIYIFIQHGKTIGSKALVIGLFPILIANLLYAPGIFDFELSKIPFLKLNHKKAIFEIFFPNHNFSREVGTRVVWGLLPDINLTTSALLLTLKTNFFYLVCFLTGAYSLGTKAPTKPKKLVVIQLFLFILLTVLIAIHAYAAFRWNICTFCIEVYLIFFAPIAVIFLVATLSELKTTQPLWKQTAVYGVIFFTYWSLGQKHLSAMSLSIANWMVPGSDFFVPGEKVRPLGSIIIYYLKITQDIFFNYFSYAVLISLTLLTALFFWGVHRTLATRLVDFSSVSPTNILLSTLVVFSFVISPSTDFGGKPRIYDCDEDMLSYYENMSAWVNSHIQQPATVHWGGTESFAPLLYTPQLTPHMSSITGGYTLRISEEPETILRYGLWTLEQKAEWRRTADYLIINNEHRPIEQEEQILDGSRTLLGIYPATTTCQENHEVYILK